MRFGAMAMARSALALPIFAPAAELPYTTRSSSLLSRSPASIRVPRALSESRFGRQGSLSSDFLGGVANICAKHSELEGGRRIVSCRGNSWDLRKSWKKTRVRAQGFVSMAASASSQTASVEESSEHKIQEQILIHQKAAAKLPALEESRTLVYQKTSGMLSTISKRYEAYPIGSLVTYASDEDGSILLSISSLSPHTKDLELNSKCSLLVPKDPSDRSDTIVTIIGDAEQISDQDASTARSTFLKKHPEAFWVDFGDFRFVRIHPKRVRYVSGLVTGLAAVSEFTGEQFQTASVDPISHFAAPIAGHMNKDHAEQTAQIVENSLGIKVDSALMRDVDRLGFSVLAKREGLNLKLRIPYPRPAEDRKDVKNLIIEMLTPKGN